IPSFIDIYQDVFEAPSEPTPLGIYVSERKKAPRYSREAFIYVGDDLLSHTLSRAVQSARRGLTSVFGMGTGISPAVRSPASQARASFLAARSQASFNAGPLAPNLCKNSSRLVGAADPSSG